MLSNELRSSAEEESVGAFSEAALEHVRFPKTLVKVADSYRHLREDVRSFQSAKTGQDCTLSFEQQRRALLA